MRDSGSERNIKWVERAIYILTFLLMLGYHFIDKAKDEATIKADMANLKKTVDEIKAEQKQKFSYYDQRWRENTKSMEHVTTLLEHLTDE